MKPMKLETPKLKSLLDKLSLKFKECKLKKLR